MEKYYCKTSTGVRPPRYEHDNIKSATEEAKQVVEFESGYSNGDDLPF